MGKKKRKAQKRNSRRYIMPPAKGGVGTSTDQDGMGRPTIWAFVSGNITSIAGCVVTTFGGNMLTGLTPAWRLFLFTVSLIIFADTWVWGLAIVLGRYYHSRFPYRHLQILVLVIVTVGIFVTTPYFAGGFLFENEGSIAMPLMTSSSENITVSLGKHSGVYSTFGDIEANGGKLPGHAIVVDNQDLFDIQIVDNKLTFYTSLYDGQGNPAVTINATGIHNMPSTWRMSQTSRVVEIVNNYGVPVFQLTYDNPYHMTVNGVLNSKMGLWVIDESGQMDQGPALPCVYTARRIFVRNFWDYFLSTKEYTVR